MEHHAHCFVGDFESAYALIPPHDTEGGPDVLLERYTQFTIAEARALKQASSQLPVSRQHRIFILSIMSATPEAQNALLKLFEEPALTARFYIIVPFEEVLISTVRSRLMIRYVEESLQKNDKLVEEFLRSTLNERLLLIAARMKEKDDAWCDALIQGLERYTQKHGEVSATELLFALRHMRGSGASKKMLLEHLALSL